MTTERLNTSVRLRLVCKDVTALLRAEIEARDWSAVHVAADRRKPVDLPEFNRRVWR
jgi:hypothetical protein